MPIERLSFDAPLAAYEQQAVDLFEGWRAGDTDLADQEVGNSRLDLEDARLAVARLYDFRNWESLRAYVAQVTSPGSAVQLFESAVEAVISGDLGALRGLLGSEPELVHARSIRVTHFDPPVHRATLLHYVAANGVEGYRQKSPPNAVEVARALLEGGAEADALADMYGGQCTTMALLVSSTHPAEAGVQVPLIELLLDHGASLEPKGAGDWTSPLMTALAFGFPDAAEALARHGARVDRLAAAAGLGRVGLAHELLSAADPLERHRALALAAQLGHEAIVRMLLDAGEDPNRLNPRGNHAHSTPLHQAVWAGHEAVVHLLVARGARVDVEDTIYRSTALGWAIYRGRKEIADWLRANTGL